MRSLTHNRAALAVHESFYVDDRLTGASSVSEAVSIQAKLQELFEKAIFLLRKWKLNQPAALRHLASHLLEYRAGLTSTSSGRFSI